MKKNKNILPLLIVSIIDHCNLNCKGCGSFAPIAEANFTSLDQHKNDMRRMSKLFDNIDEIQIQGGETLLYPDIEQIICVTREFFPVSIIKIITNGILLSKMPKSFWKTLKKYNVNIEITVYPPFVTKQEEFKKLADMYNINVTFRSNISRFFKTMDLKGNFDYIEKFEKCKWKFCRFLKNGELCSCGAPILKKIFIKHFKEEFVLDGIINIHNTGLTGSKVLEFLETPFEHCKYCSEEKYFDWDVSKKEKEEWCV